MTPLERDLVVFHAVFLTVAIAALVLRGGIDHGVVMTYAVLVYHLGSVAVSTWRGHDRWRRWWTFGAVLSVFMVLPDAVLVRGLGVLEFPPDGAPNLGPVTAYMAGLWAIPTVVIVGVAEAVAYRRGDRAAAITAALVAVVVFGVAEATLTLLPVWEPVGVTTIGGFAPYILLPEVLLGWMMFAGARWTRTGRAIAIVPVAAGIALTYTGAAAVSWLLIERGLLS
ncbi:MAG: hypothetical protein WEB03_10110 [Nitriliruptor sp.]|uniref:DUF6989 domain-containing protein n=1 Tax=Nitriliruptor sp. TaxID=2448056 RepID=UPI00349FFAA2